MYHFPSLDRMSSSPHRVESGRVEKAGKISKSCDRCKLKKIKCDQKKPVCDNCSKYEEECVFSVMKKPGLRSGYGQQVFDRISELDRYIEENKAQHDEETRRLTEQILILELKLQLIEQKIPSSTPLTANPFSRPGEFTPNGGVNLVPHSVPSAVLVPHLVPAATSGVENPEGLPSLEKIETLVDCYFEYINPIFPILHPQIDRSRLLRSLDQNEILVMAILLAALKFAALFSPEESEEYFAAYKKRIISTCFGVKTVQELRAVTLLAFTLYSRSNNHEAWSVISLAVGGCTHLGLTREPAIDDKDEWENWVDRESIRNLVWEIYKLDKLSSMGSHFTSKLPDEEVAILLPAKTDFWEFKYLYNKAQVKNQTRALGGDGSSDSLYSINSYIIEVIYLMGICSEFRKSLLDIKDMKSILSWQLSCYEFENKIESWKDSLPEPVRHFLDTGALVSSKIGVNDIILHALYHTMIIRLHSTTAFSHFQDKYLISASTSKTKCINSSHQILKISEALPTLFQTDMASVYELFGPYYAFAVWVSGRVILVNSIHTKDSLSPEFDHAIELLRNLGSKWECAAKYADILEFFKDDTMTVDTSSLDGTGEDYFSNAYSEDAKVIADLKLNASTLDSLLSKKVARYKGAKGSLDDLSIFDWFKLPLNDAFVP